MYPPTAACPRRAEAVGGRGLARRPRALRSAALSVGESQATAAPLPPKAITHCLFKFLVCFFFCVNKHISQHKQINKSCTATSTPAPRLWKGYRSARTMPENRWLLSRSLNLAGCRCCGRRPGFLGV